MNRYIEHFIGHRFNGIAPISRLQHVRCPVLLVHGTNDKVVPMQCAHMLLRSQPLAQLMPVSGTHEVFEDQARLEQDVMVCSTPSNPACALAAKPLAVQLQPAHQ